MATAQCCDSSRAARSSATRCEKAAFGATTGKAVLIS
jgi:hypothetical protein